MQMAFRLKEINLFHWVKLYFRRNIIFSIVALYFFVSVFVKIVFSINIMIPCLWKTLFHVDCPGCGLSRAFTDIVRFDFNAAYQNNKLIFIVLPILLVYMIYDLVVFIKKNNKKTSAE